MAKARRNRLNNLKWNTRVNPLLATPPKGVHKLDVAGSRWFQRVMGRPTRPEDYHGVHTTGNEAIALIYAMGAVKSEGGFPVIIVLNVQGLTALPDVDAMAQAADLLDDRSIRSSYEGMDLMEACDYSAGESETIRAGDDAAVAFMSHFEQDRLCQSFDDDEEWERWLKTGKYSAETATNVVDQRRYMQDFGLNRLVEVRAAKPWWPYIVDEPYDERESERLEKIEEAGYKPISHEELFSGNLVDSRAIAKGHGKKGFSQYHGTSSVLAQKAFPSLGKLNNPYHTGLSVEDVQVMLEAEGLTENPRRSRKAKRKKKSKGKRATNVRNLVAKALK